MNTSTQTQPCATIRVTLEPSDAHRLANLCGHLDENLRQIERRLNIDIRARDNLFSLTGSKHEIRAGSDLLRGLYLDSNNPISPDEIHLALQTSRIEALMESYVNNDTKPDPDSLDNNNIDSDSATPQDGAQNITDSRVEHLTLIRTKKCNIKPRGINQQRYVRAVQTNDINFGIGPAGTGKTYLAVACAVESLLKDEVERILLVRPAVEAGEKLGFLPGDLSQKVDPYLRPLYDALFEMLGFETVEKLIERNVIEVAPLAYMRGRTLNNAFIILDESQNTTREQMKMFLTRIGFGSTAVITGDPSQIDLPKGIKSGLRHAAEVLNEVKGISMVHFDAKDVVRHPLVQRIVEAYDTFEDQHGSDSH